MAQRGGTIFLPIALARGIAQVYLRPGPATLEAQLPEANWGAVLLSLLVAGLGAGVLRLAGAGVSGLSPLAALGGGLVLVVILFCTVVLFTLLVAWRLHGTGDVLDHTYALALIWPPVLILIGLPLNGNLIWLSSICFWLPAFGYALYLTYNAARAAHGLSAPAARLVAYTPLLLLLVLLLLLWLLLFLSTNAVLTVPLPPNVTPPPDMLTPAAP